MRNRVPTSPWHWGREQLTTHTDGLGGLGCTVGKHADHHGARRSETCARNRNLGRTGRYTKNKLRKKKGQEKYGNNLYILVKKGGGKEKEKDFIAHVSRNITFIYFEVT